MRKMKRKVCLTLAFIMGIQCWGMPAVQAVEATKNGFTFDSANYSVTWKTAGSYPVYTDVGTKLGTMTYTIGRARYKNTKEDTLLVKMVMTPYNAKVKLTSNGTYGYGLSEYVSVKDKLSGTIGDYRPVNNPSNDSVSLSLGASKSGASISASYSIVHNDLDITAKCNTPENTYYIVYDYKPSIANPLAKNKYVANESAQYGMAQFTASKNTYSTTLNFDARFGSAEDNAASPWLINLNYVKKATKAVTYDF